MAVRDYLQGNDGTGAGTLTFNIPIITQNVGAGNTLFLWLKIVDVGAGDAFPTSIVDTDGNNWVLNLVQHTGDASVCMHYANNIIGGTQPTVTVTLPVARQWYANLGEFEGDLVLHESLVAGASGNSNAPITAAMGPTTNPEVLVLATSSTEGSVIHGPAPGGWVTRNDQFRFGAHSRTVDGIGSYPGECTLSSARTWDMVGCILAEAGAPPVDQVGWQHLVNIGAGFHG